MPSLEYRAPAQSLRDYVSVYYFFDCPEDNFEDIERAAVAQLRFILQGSGDAYFIDGHHVHIAEPTLIGPTTAHNHFKINGPFRMFGMGLLPAGWGAVTLHSAADIVDRAIPAVTMFSKIQHHNDALQQCESIEQMARRADTVLKQMVSRASPEVLAFTKMVDGWLAADPSPSVQELRDISGLSARQLARKVKHYYGMSPKYLSRKYRALRAARALVDANNEDADYLRDAFYDQSHMIRELKIFAGMTPHELRGSEEGLARLINQRSQLDGEISALTSRT